MIDHPTRWDRFGLKYLQYWKPHDVFHCGVDYNWGIGNQDLGQPVWTPTYGVVEYVSPYGHNGGLGNYVVVYHPWHAVWTRYLHLDRMDCSIGQILERKGAIGTLGKTGSSYAHLHFEVLNHEGHQFIKHWNRPYGRYPSGLSKSKVASMFLDPITWIETNDHPKSPEEMLAQAQRAIRTAKGARLRRLHRRIDRLLHQLGVE
jgi:murein DD-endopeptidase MepM/ murein hydrolase activator NlpD